MSFARKFNIQTVKQHIVRTRTFEQGIQMNNIIWYWKSNMSSHDQIVNHIRKRIVVEHINHIFDIIVTFVVVILKK